MPLLDLGNGLLAKLQTGVSANDRVKLFATIDSTTRCTTTLDDEDGSRFSAGFVLREK